MMAYGDDVKTAFDLKALSDFKQFDDSVSIAPYVGGRAHTGKALSQLKTGLFAMSGRQDAPRALILLSSGGSADDVVAPGAELRDSGVKVTTIGLGKQANVRELITVASEPKSEHVFTAFLDTLPNAMDEIIQGVCRGNLSYSLDIEYTTVSMRKQKHVSSKIPPVYCLPCFTAGSLLVLNLHLQPK